MARKGRISHHRRDEIRRVMAQTGKTYSQALAQVDARQLFVALGIDPDFVTTEDVERDAIVRAALFDGSRVRFENKLATPLLGHPVRKFLPARYVESAVDLAAARTGLLTDFQTVSIAEFGDERGGLRVLLNLDVRGSVEWQVLTPTPTELALHESLIASEAAAVPTLCGNDLAVQLEVIVQARLTPFGWEDIEVLDAVLPEKERLARYRGHAAVRSELDYRVSDGALLAFLDDASDGGRDRGEAPR